MFINRWKLALSLTIAAFMAAFALHLFARASYDASGAVEQANSGGEWILEVFQDGFAAIDMVSAEEGWIAADRGRFYQFDGEGWLLAASIDGNADIAGIDMISPSSGWAVGKVRDATDTQGAGGIWRYQNGRWEAVTTPESGVLLDVDMVSETEGWAVGDGGAILSYNGVIWEQLDYWGGDLRAVKMVSSTVGWAVGYGTILRFDGTQWQRVGDEIDLDLNDVDVLPDGQMYAVGNDGIGVHYNGESFETIEGLGAYGIDMLSADEGWAVSDGAIFHFSGGKWTPTSYPQWPDMVDIQMISETEGWIVRRGGGVLYYNGQDWVDRSDRIAPQSAYDDTFFLTYDLDMVSKSDAWAIVDAGLFGNGARQFLHYTGTVWEAVPLSDSVAGLINPTAIDMVEADDGWAFGNHDGGIYALHYDGHDWQATDTNLDGEMHDLHMLSSDIGWAVGISQTVFGSNPPLAMRYDGTGWQSVPLPPDSPYPAGVSVVAADEIWTVGSSGGQTIGSAVMHFDGNEWQEATVPANTDGLSAVDMLSANDGWAVGGNGAILHYNGSSWERVTSPTAFSLMDLEMVSSSKGWAVGGGGSGESIILYYDGVNWQEVFSPANWALRTISMLDDKTGRIGGRGLILKPSSADLVIDKSASPQPASSGRSITYTVTVTNTGPTYAQNVVIADALPADTAYGGLVSAPASLVQPSPNEPTWQVQILHPGAYSVVFTATVDSAFIGTMTNTVEITTTTPLTDINGLKASVETTVIQATSTVTGTILDDQGNGIEGATVTLTDTVQSAGATGPAFEASGTTDANGGFRIENVPLGQYTLSVTLPGQGEPAHEQTVVVGPGTLTALAPIVVSQRVYLPTIRR